MGEMIDLAVTHIMVSREELEEWFAALEKFNENVHETHVPLKYVVPVMPLAGAIRSHLDRNS